MQNPQVIGVFCLLYGVSVACLYFLVSSSLPGFFLSSFYQIFSRFVCLSCTPIVSLSNKNTHTIRTVIKGWALTTDRSCFSLFLCSQDVWKPHFYYYVICSLELPRARRWGEELNKTEVIMTEMLFLNKMMRWYQRKSSLSRVFLVSPFSSSLFMAQSAKHATSLHTELSDNHTLSLSSGTNAVSHITSTDVKQQHASHSSFNSLMLCKHVLMIQLQKSGWGIHTVSDSCPSICSRSNTHRGLTYRVHVDTSCCITPTFLAQIIGPFTLNKEDSLIAALMRIICDTYTPCRSCSFWLDHWC